MLIDTHSHINFKDYKDDGDEIVEKTIKENVWMINIGAQYSTSRRAVEYAEKYEKGIYAAVGLHPIHVQATKEKEWDGTVSEREFEEYDEKKYKKLLESPKVVAVGEIGLDYYRIDNKEEIKDKQKEVFLQQLDLARQMDKPVIIHCRDAYEDLVSLIKIFSIGCAGCPYSCPSAGEKKIKGVIHSFCGNLEQAKEFIDLGFLIGFNGIITFSNQYDKIIKEIPLEKILLETDCPYLTPVPHRGKRNEPLYVKFVAEKIAELKGISFEQVAEQTTKNAKELFNL